MANGKATPRSHLAFKTPGNRNGDPRRDESSLSGLQDNVRIDASEEVHSRGPFSHVLREKNRPIGS